MRGIAAAVLALGAVVLAGCEDTTFETQPSHEMAACDPHFVGQWRLLAPDRDKRSREKQDDDLFLIVEPECRRWRFIEDGKDDEKTERTTHFAFATVGGKPLLSVKLDAETADANDPQARWKNGYYFFRYHTAGAAIRVYSIDHRRMAHLIVDGKVRGRTERITREPGSTPKTGEFASQNFRDELHNFVAGNENEMARVAQLDGIFDTRDFYTLKPATDAEIFQPAKKPAQP